jgi:hypothetical protein
MIEYNGHAVIWITARKIQSRLGLRFRVRNDRRPKTSGADDQRVAIERLFFEDDHTADEQRAFLAAMIATASTSRKALFAPSV